MSDGDNNPVDFLTYIKYNAKEKISSSTFDTIYCLIIHDGKPVRNIRVGLERFSPIFYKLSNKLYDKSVIDWYTIYQYIDSLDLYICYELSAIDNYYKIFLRKFYKDFFMHVLLFLNSKINYDQLTSRLSRDQKAFNAMVYNCGITDYSYIHKILWDKLISIQTNIEAYKLLFNLT